jgi:D-alanyl-D-alanine carboxypeptidase
MDLKNGETVYGKNIHKRLYPASTTKILTAIIAIESGKMDRSFTVGANPPLVEPSKIYVKKDEKINLRELVYGLMLESANDAALAIAEGIGGSQEGFAKIMNEKVKKLGCKESNFVNPSGLPHTKHYTTAYDLAIITKYAMGNSEFKKIIGAKYYTMHKTNKSEVRNLTNHNKMLSSNSEYYYKGCIGGKTGYTNAASHTYVSIATRDKKTLIAVVLKDTEPAYYDAIKMFNCGFSVK